MRSAVTPLSTEPSRLDAAVARLREAAPRWASARPRERAMLARALLRGMRQQATSIVRAACQAKGIRLGSPAEGDEWVAGVYPVLRILRQLAESLSALERRGRTPFDPLGETADGRARATVFPSGALDAVMFPGVRAEVHFQEGVRPRDVLERCGRFHKAPDHDGRVCLVLGAGNVNSIPPADVATKLFNEGKVCVLKVNPVNAYLGPLLEAAFAEAIARGVVAVVQGGRDEGAYLAAHPGVDEIHLTGSNATHDTIVWGPPGPDREARLARREPLLSKPMTSELGDVSPVLVVPGRWSDLELAFQAESVAGMVTQNGSYNCLAARLVLLPRGWPERARFLELVLRALAAAPPRPGWYPGAAERLAAMTGGHREVRAVTGAEGTLPWTLVTGLDPDGDDPLFTTEAFCPILAETSIGSSDPLEYLDAAVRFANERLWGTLSAQLVAPGRALADPTIGGAVRAAVRRLEYGTVAVNVFSGYGFALGTTPWGGFPGQPLHDVRSGRGFVHNTRMLEDVEKSVITAPALQPMKPVYFPTHRTVHRMGPRMIAFEGARDPSVLPAIALDALRG